MLLSENIFRNKSLLFELELQEYFDMITKQHLISACRTKDWRRQVLFVFCVWLALLCVLLVMNQQALFRLL